MAADRPVMPAQQSHDDNRKERQQCPRGEHGQHYLESRDPDAVPDREDSHGRADREPGPDDGAAD
jgi:hypothetical protein